MFHERSLWNGSCPCVEPWLKECDKLHLHCQEARRSLPKRLVEIAGSIRLVETAAAELDPNTKYATLSHCWGSEQDAVSMMKTLSSNIQERMVSIDPLEFPPLFRDAIRIVLALGLRVHLDRLTLHVQDDQSDWRLQSVFMAEVYSYAYLNLAASALKNSSGSMLRDRTCSAGSFRRHRALPISAFEIPGSPDTDARAVVRHSFGQQHEDPYGLARPWEPLLRRAWVFQERPLSRRTIHIGSSEIMWGCRCCYHCECGMIGPPFRLPGHALPTQREVMAEDLPTPRHGTRILLGDTAVTKKTSLNKACAPGASAIHALDFWMLAVEEHSALDLIYESDRLVALGGIARKIHETTGFTYLAGLWLEDLPRSLRWTGWGFFEPSDTREPSANSLPSWSWISRRRGSTLGSIHWERLRWYSFHEDRSLTDPPARDLLPVRQRQPFRRGGLRPDPPVGCLCARHRKSCGRCVGVH